MKPKLISILVASAFVPALAQAQEPQRTWSGSVSIGARHSAVNANDPSKFNEYRDLEDGTQPFGGFEVRQRAPNYYLNGYGENIGRDDQYLDLNGGSYGSFKYRLYSDKLRHNFGSGPGARTPFFGAGSDTLTLVPNTLDTATWNTFDHSYKRHNFGGMFELQKTSPWYFRVDANEVKRDGINVFSGAKGTSPGNGFMELPAPIDYTAKNISGEVGFSNRRGHFAVNLLHSKFDNGNETLRWQNNFFGGLDTTTLPPDNSYNRLGINGNIRGLPMDSTLAARYTHSTLKSDTTLQQTMLSTGATNPATNPSEPSFHGEHKRDTLSLSYASRPTPALDTRVYWNYDKLKNKSTDITFSPAVGSGLLAGSTDPTVNCANVAGAVCEPELFHYTKKNIGVEGGYRLSRENKVSAGVDYNHTDRERADFVRTRELKLFGEWKNSSLDWATGRVKYQFTNRRSDFEPSTSVLNANPMDLFVRRFDLANAHQHLIKAVADATVGAGFDVGLEAIFKWNDYLDAPLGRNADKRQEYYASVGWGDPKAFRVLAFGDIEYANYDSRHRVGTGNPDPSAGAIASPATYNWTANNKDTAWQIGIGADWAPRSRLTIKSSLIYAQTNGEATFSASPPAGVTPSIAPIRNFDNTRRTAFTVRGIYEFTRQWEFTAGYAYEKYRFSDIGYDNTRYIALNATAANNPAQTSYTTGQFAFQPYSANVVFGIAKYKF